MCISINPIIAHSVFMTISCCFSCDNVISLEQTSKNVIVEKRFPLNSSSTNQSTTIQAIKVGMSTALFFCIIDHCNTNVYFIGNVTVVDICQ